VTAHLIFPNLLTPFFYNFLADWIALIVTRRVLLYISTMKSVIAIIFTLVLSVCVILLISIVGFTLFLIIASFVFGFRELVSREERCHGDLSGLSRLAAAVNATKIEDNKRASH